MRCQLVLTLVTALLLSSPAVAEQVDLELVLAVDVSMSMDPEEQRVQRDGYADAIKAPEVLRAIANGVHGRIAVTYVEWAGAAEQHVRMPWTVIDGPATAEAFSQVLRDQSLQRIRRTSISGAIAYSASLFDQNDFEAFRRVIDVSGDGPNNQGAIVTQARDAAIADGITINGLPLMFRTGGMLDIDWLDEYYRDCVVGGAGAFVLPVKDKDGFARAIRDKLVLEISGLPPAEPAIVPASTRPAVSCTIGEYLWQQRMEN
jgi:hypothetical protein